jgi:hypothetical protein
MSFIRPEALATIRRFGEPVFFAVIAGVCFWKGATLIGKGSWFGLLPIAIFALCSFAVIGTVERALVSRRSGRNGPGVVSIHEGRISYFGPEGGAVLALDALTSVDIMTNDLGPWEDDVHWVLRDEMGQMVTIPASAANADTLLDTLGGLPGFDNMAVVLAMGSTENAEFRIWRRKGYDQDGDDQSGGGHAVPRVG